MMDYPVQWDIMVEILGVLLGLVHNNWWHGLFPISWARDKYRAPHMSGSWLDIIKTRRDDHFLQDRLIVIILIK